MNQKILLPAYKERPPLYPFSLAFVDPKTETAFYRFYTEKSIGFARIVLLLAIFLIMVFAVLDGINLPDYITPIMHIRVVMCIFILGCIMLTFTSPGINHMQLLMSVVVIGASAGIIAMIYETSQVGGHTYYAALILAIMYAHGLMRLRFIYASISTWCVIGGYFLASFLLMNPGPDIIINNAFFLIAANIMGMFTSYWIEFYMRNSFWQAKQLEKKTDELKHEFKRKSNELNISRRLQLDMLPDSFPEHPDYACCFYMTTAAEIGGDYYDYMIDSRQQITFSIGDATGHGARAGAMVTAMKILFLEHAEKVDLVEFLNYANENIRRIGFNKLYMSFAIFRVQSNWLTIAGAGLPAGLLYRAKSGRLERIELKGFPLGSPANFPYRQLKLRLDAGDTLMFMTDGLPELFNKEREMYGFENVSTLFCRYASFGLPE
jgi:hypothetical protein